MTTFKQFVKRYERINHRFGDLSDDITLDDDFPESTDFYTNLNYLTDRHVDQAVIETFYEVWAAYRQSPEDQITLYIALLMEKIDILIGVNGHIADALKAAAERLDIMTDLDAETPIGHIAANVGYATDLFEELITKDKAGAKCLSVNGMIDTFEQN